jgi:hypothetical protein
LNIILADVLIRGQKCHVFCQRRGNQKPVKGVTVKEWQLNQSVQMVLQNWQNGETVAR